MYIERLDFGEEVKYSAYESTIHLGRYLLTKQFCQGKKVLDIACGEGYGSFAMAEHWGASEVYGLDIDKDSVEKAHRYFNAENIHYQCYDAEKAAELFEEKSFDLIVSFETIEHLQNPDLFIENIKKLIKDDGTIIISCPNDHWYYKSPTESNPFHVRKYMFEEFMVLCESKLGQATKYMLGLPSGGFSNIELNVHLITETENNMNSMFKYEDQNCIVLPSDKAITPSTSSYFIGIWSKEGTIVENTSCIYAYSMNDSDYMTCQNLKNDIKNLEAKLLELNNEISELNSNISELNNEISEQNNNNKKLSLAIKGTNKENDFLKHNMWLMQQIEQENKQLLNIKQDEINTLLNSRSWKLTAPLRKLLRILKKS